MRSFFVDVPVSEQGVDVDLCGVVAHFHQEILVGLAVNGMIDVIDRAAVLRGVAESVVHAQTDRLHGRVLLDQGLSCVVDDLLEQRGNVLIVIIERIAADVAGVDDAAHADFVERTFVQKLQKGFLIASLV